MFISFQQIRTSLKRLEPVHPFFMITFLVCKKDKLPVGQKAKFGINKAEKDFLDAYYKPCSESSWYYRVSRVGRKKQYWVDAKYASSTLQSMRTREDLREAFLHEKNTNLWGWSKDYVEILRSYLALQRD
ncbi:MAG: hypothetical protein ACLQPD_02640 [Desulfomonilaceae bacterium]